MVVFLTRGRAVPLSWLGLPDRDGCIRSVRREIVLRPAGLSRADGGRWRGFREIFDRAGAALIAGGLIAAPFGVPMLPADVFIRYSELLPMVGAVKTERDAVNVELPQLYADMFGWNTLAATVAQVYWALPAGE